MHTNFPQWITGLCAVGALSGCVAAERQPAEPGQAVAGWYMEHSSRATLQPCGQSKSLQVSASADLPARAKAFGLVPDSPVYVRVVAKQRGNAIDVTRVEQFGSTTPVRDCPMTGVVLPAPTP
jgi:hypothetical protein